MRTYLMGIIEGEGDAAENEEYGDYGNDKG